MKKIGICLFIFLTACMQAPQWVFQTNSKAPVYSLNVHEVEIVSLTPSFDTAIHIENEMPISPEEAVIQWSEEHLKSSQDMNDEKLVIIVHSATMTKEEKINAGFFKLNEEIYTLNYDLEIQIRQKDNLLQTNQVKGKGFATLAKKSSLTDKEKNWAWLIQKMLNHLHTKIKTDFKNVIISQD